MSSNVRADKPTAAGGKQYGIRLSAGELPSTVLLPGDPDRVATLAEVWDESEELVHHREFRSARGTYRGVPIGACSTGIGGASTEVALNELATIGCDTFIRLGTTGGLQERIRLGDVIISTASIRWDGASAAYAPPEYPAAASYEVVLALVEACERLELRYHLGVSATVSSFFAGQSRPAFAGFGGRVSRRADELREMGVLNFEMEAATIFTLCSLFGLRGGAACVVIADRFRNEWRPEGADQTLAKIGAEAALVLAEIDKSKAKADKRWYYRGLHEGE